MSAAEGAPSEVYSTAEREGMVKEREVQQGELLNHRGPQQQEGAEPLAAPLRHVLRLDVATLSPRVVHQHRPRTPTTATVVTLHL